MIKMLTFDLNLRGFDGDNYFKIIFIFIFFWVLCKEIGKCENFLIIIFEYFFYKEFVYGLKCYI